MIDWVTNIANGRASFLQLCVASAIVYYPLYVLVANGQRWAGILAWVVFLGLLMSVYGSGLTPDQEADKTQQEIEKNYAPLRTG